MSVRLVHQDVSRLQVFVDDAALMDLADGRGDADGELEKPRRLHWLSKMPVERFAARILEDQHRPIAIANQFQGPRGPRALQVVLEPEFVGEPINAGRPWALGDQPQRQHATPRQLLVRPPSAIERALAVLPQHLAFIVAGASAERDVGTH